MWWSKTDSPGAALGSSRPCSRRAAIAIPTALPMPWPRGPVVVSTPAVWPYSGWPGRLAAPGAQRLEVLELEAPATEVELDVERQAGVAAGEHEPVASGPVRVGRVVPHHLLEQQVRRRRQAHRRAGVTVAHLLHGIHGQHTHGVDCAIVELGPVESGFSGHVGGVLSSASRFGFEPSPQWPCRSRRSVRGPGASGDSSPASVPRSRSTIRPCRTSCAKAAKARPA